jgi:L-ribulose-5-phosphate 3-epimerase
MDPNLNRREFVKLSGAAVAGAAWAGVPLAHSAFAKPANKRGLRKGVNLGMIATKGSILDKFKLLKDLGFDGIEINYPNGPDKKEVLRARDATGIAVGNIIDSVHWKETLTDPDPAVRARGLAGLRQALHDAKELGSPGVLLVAGVVNKQVSYDDAYRRSQAEIRKAAPLAEELEVKIDIENVWNHFLLSPLEAARFVDELNSPAVGWHFDVGNVIVYGWPEQWVRILNKRIVTVHIKEYSRKLADNEGLWKGFSVPLLEGDNNWPVVMQAFDDIGFHGWCIAEIPGGNRDRLQDIAERMDRIFNS